MTFQSRVHTSMVHPAVDMPITLCVTAFLQSVHCFFSLVSTVVVVAAAAVAGVVAFGELLLWEPYFLWEQNFLSKLYLLLVLVCNKIENDIPVQSTHIHGAPCHWHVNYLLCCIFSPFSHMFCFSRGICCCWGSAVKWGSAVVVELLLWELLFMWKQNLFVQAAVVVGTVNVAGTSVFCQRSCLLH